MKIIVVGLGSGSLSSISYGAYSAIKNANNIFFRTIKHPIIDELILNNGYSSFDYLYEEKNDFETVYKEIVNVLVDKATQLEEIIYAVPGNPKVAEKSVEYLLFDSRLVEKNIDIEIISSGSFLEDMFVYLDIDPVKNALAILDALDFKDENIFGKMDFLFTQVYSKHIASELKIRLGKYLADDTKVILFKGAGIESLEMKCEVNLYEIDRVDFDFDHLSSVFIKYDECNYKNKTIFDLMNIIAILRGEHGCPWDKKQDKYSIIKNMKEELEELILAIENDDIDNTLEELGDILMLIVMQGRFAEEEYLFDFFEVINEICKKLIFRHPHVFGKEKAMSIEEANYFWNRQKSMEK